MQNTDNSLAVSFCYKMIGNDGFSQRTRETSLDSKLLNVSMSMKYDTTGGHLHTLE